VKHGDIVLIEHHDTSHSGVYKIRPALIISANTYNDREEDRILIPITSNIERQCPDDVIIECDDKEFTASGLKVSSAFRTGKIFTAHKSLIKRKLGKISVSRMATIGQTLRKIINL